MTYEPNIDEWIYLIKGNHIEHCQEQELSPSISFPRQ